MKRKKEKGFPKTVSKTYDENGNLVSAEVIVSKTTFIMTDEEAKLSHANYHKALNKKIKEEPHHRIVVFDHNEKEIWSTYYFGDFDIEKIKRHGIML